MSQLCENTSDLEVYAQRLGLTGSDFDMFYESYYQMDLDEVEEILDLWEGQY